MAATYSPAGQSHHKPAQWARAVPVSRGEDSEYDDGYVAELPDNSSSNRNNSAFHSNGLSHELDHKVSRKRSIGSGPHERSVDDSAWIHRDKLAQIETREMLDAGLRIPRSMSRNANRSVNRSTSRGSKRSSSRNADPAAALSLSESDLATYFGDRATSPPVPSIPAGAENWDGRGSGLVETRGFGFEEAEEQAQFRKRSNSKPSISKIPISRSGAMSAMSGSLERESPILHGRQGSSSAFTSSPEITTNSRKRRSRSLGSQHMLEEAGIPRPRTPRSRPASSHLDKSPNMQHDSSDSYSSPNQARNGKAVGLNIKKGGNTTPRNGSLSKARGASAAAAVVKDSPSSIASAANKAKSRARPEGEPPWLATMYKPDPMLPPDQQMLPTHAKKIMREQWEREGKIGNIYDTEFNLLNDADPSGGKQPPAQTAATASQQSTAQQLQHDPASQPPSRQPSPPKRQQQQAPMQQQQETFPKPWSGDTSIPRPDTSASAERPQPQPSSEPNKDRDKDAAIQQPRATSRAGSVTYRITPTIPQTTSPMPLSPAGGAQVASASALGSIGYRSGAVSADRGAGSLYRTSTHDTTRPQSQQRQQGGMVLRRLSQEKMPLGEEGPGEKTKKGCCCVVM